MQIRKAKVASKVLVVTQNLPPAICGVGDYVTYFIQELRRQQPEISFAFLTRSLKEGKVKFAPDHNLPPALAECDIYPVTPLFWTLRKLPALIKTVRQSQATIVHLHYVPQMYYRAGVGIALPLFALILRLLGLRVIITFHELYISWQPDPKQLIIGLIQRLNFWLLLMLTNETIVTTQSRARTLRRVLFWYHAKAQRVIVSPVGSNFPKTQTSDFNQTKLLQKWNLPINALILSCLGTPRWSEQLNWLAEALLAVKATQPTALLLLIGFPAELLPESHLLSGREDVICTGFGSASEVSEFLSCTDIYLLPLDDGVSSRRTALMAALQHGLPVVTTRGLNTEPAFVAGLPVLLCSTNKPADFVRLVVELADNKALRQELGQKALNYYQANFSWEKIVQQQQFLFSILKRKQRSRR